MHLELSRPIEDYHCCALTGCCQTESWNALEYPVAGAFSENRMPELESNEISEMGGL